MTVGGMGFIPERLLMMMMIVAVLLVLMYYYSAIYILVFLFGSDGTNILAS